MRVRWIGYHRIVNGQMRVAGEEYDIPDDQVIPHIADGCAEPITPPSRLTRIREEED